MLRRRDSWLLRRPVGLLCLALAACSSARGSASRSTFDRQLAAVEPAPSAAHYGPPRTAKPLPLAPGQWVKQHVVDQDGHHALVTTKVIALFGRQVWIEREIENADGTRAMKLLLSPGDGKTPHTIDIYQYWVKHPDGRVEQLPAMLLGSLKPELQRSLAEVLVAHRAQAREDVAVKAGAFARAYKARVRAGTLGSDAMADTWWHSGVPFNGLLRTMGVSAPGQRELVAFGLSGAKSAF